jgi:hypothetical protein
MLSIRIAVLVPGVMPTLKMTAARRRSFEAFFPWQTQALKRREVPRGMHRVQEIGGRHGIQFREKPCEEGKCP